MSDFAFVVRFAEGLAFVVGMLTLAEGYLHLREPAFVDEEFERDDGLAGILGGFLEFAYLASLQQQFAVAFRLMISVRAKAVLGYVHLLDVNFAMLHGAVRIDQRSFTLADGFDLRTEQLNTGGETVKNDVLKLSLLV